MQKIKLFKIMALSTPVIVTPLLANSCSITGNITNRFDPSNFSTYGKAQLKIITDQVINEVKKNPNTTWENGNFISAIEKGFELIFPQININGSTSGNAALLIASNVDKSAIVKNVLATGTTWVIVAEQPGDTSHSYVKTTGGWSFIIKANI